MTYCQLDSSPQMDASSQINHSPQMNHSPQIHSPDEMGSPTQLNASMQTSVNHSMMGGGSDQMSDPPSSPESPPFDDTDLLSSAAASDNVTAQLAAAGPVGVAAAAAIATGKKRKRPHQFETNPSIRKRQQTRLLRKLKVTIDEYTTRVGQQAVVLAVTPGKPQNNFKVFGAHPLENVIRSCRNVIMQELEAALAQQAPPQTPDDPSLHELPPLVIDGIPTPVEKMTQAQLRCFIPLMLKYSTGRGKPGWGRESTRPLWWPKDLPWANVRSDARSEEEKQKISWTHALRQIVLNCYKFHGRDDLLPTFNEEDEEKKVKAMQMAHSTAESRSVATSTVPTLCTASGNEASSPNSAAAAAVAAETALATVGAHSVRFSLVASGDQTRHALYAQPIATHYGPTMVQTITNPDGTMSIIHVDPNSAVVTLPDGTQAQVRTVSAIQSSQEATQAVQTLAEVAASHQDGTPQVAQLGTVNMDLNGDATAQAVATLAEATLNSDGQIILTGEDGTQSVFFLLNPQT